MPQNYDTEFTVNHTGENVVIKNEKTQNFSEEDFVQVYKDTKQNLDNLEERLESVEEEIEEVLNEKNEAMARIHAQVKSEQQGEEELEEAGIELDTDTLTVDDLNTYMQLQQKDNQREQLQNRVEQVRDQVQKMEPVAEKLDDSNE